MSTDAPRKQMISEVVLVSFHTQIEVRPEQVAPPMTLKFSLEAATEITLTGTRKQQFFGDHTRRSRPTRRTIKEEARASDEYHYDVRFDEEGTDETLNGERCETQDDEREERHF